MTLIEQIRERAGVSVKKDFAKMCNISYSRYLLIEQMLLKATEAEFYMIGGTDYEAYLVELGCGKMINNTERLIELAMSTGMDRERAIEIVNKWANK